MQQPQRMLISSYFANNMLFTTPLLKWYLEHGLIMSNIKQVVHFRRLQCFSSFVDEVTSARREGDRDPSKRVQSDIMKLMGNSSYGRSITRVERHKKVMYT